MFMLNGSPLSPDSAFTTNEIQYPANWLRLASPEERAAIGITEVADVAPHDDRFYWVLATKEDGSPLMVQVYDAATQNMVDTDVQVIQRGLKHQMIAQIKQTAGLLLAQTDWKVTRAAEGVKAVDAATLAARAAIRAASDTNEAAITSCTSVDELAALQMNWPQE
jgi:hypothetical protein